ncbi:MAG TPA: MFS transporter [Myxococcota bacterium]|nr:MFS transporter [Myxococcota bacterium]
MATATSERAAVAPASRAEAQWVLGLLFVVYVFNFVDRQILSILVEPIRRELGVSDTAMGFLTGGAFAVFYTFAGIPIARFADRSVRRTVIAVGCAVWSAMTAASGLARGFADLALARVGVGVGEAACSPPAHSLLADYFPPERRATALAIYASGIHFGTAFGYLAGGWINAVFDWRTAFMAVGLPGLALALLVRLTVREPERGLSEGGAAAESVPDTSEVFRFLWALPSFRHLSFASALTAFAGYGVAIWTPAFLMRVHGMGSGEIGTWLGLIAGLGGASGAWLGGVTVDRLGARDPRYSVLVPAAAALAGLPFAMLLLFWPEPRVALVLGIPATVVGAMWLGPVFALTQTLVRIRMRAVASAILLFVVNLIGLGLGPQVVGALNDALRPSYGDAAVRYSLAGVVVVMHVWAALHFALAARTLRRDLGAKAAA